MPEEDVTLEQPDDEGAAPSGETSAAAEFNSPAGAADPSVEDQAEVEQLLASASARARAGRPAQDPEHTITADSKLPAETMPMDLPDLGMPHGHDEPRQSIDLLEDVGLQVKIELGRSRMLVEDVLRLGEGSVVELDKLAGDPVDVYVNDRLVARGEVLVLNDNFCVRVNEIISDVSKDFQTA